jgi:hypothetical protein
MVSIAPNQKKDEQLASFVTLVVRIESIEHLLGPKAFLSDSTKEVAASVAEAVATSLKVGMLIRCKIRKAPDHFFIIPDSIQTVSNQ